MAAGRDVHECELAIVIGKQGRDIPRAAWQQYVVGYSCLVDVTIRGSEERVGSMTLDVTGAASLFTRSAQTSA